MIRDATAADLPAILALNLESWRDAYASLLPAAFLATGVEDFLGARWRALPDPGWLLVEEAAAGLRGFVAVERGGGAREVPDLPLDYVRAFHVRPALRRQGVGRRLFAALQRRLVDAGASGVWLDVAEANDGAREAYRRFGGVEGPPFAEDIAGHPVTGLRVVWRW